MGDSATESLILDSLGKQRKNLVPALPIIVSMSPPGYPSAWLRPSRARFFFTLARLLWLRLAAY
jgi:hypothetical protein